METEQIEHLKSSFDNVQELIKFTDQKIAAVLVVCGIKISIFFEQIKSLVFDINNLNFNSIAIFVSGIIISVITVVILYLSIINVLKPGFAKFYKNSSYSTYYFEHIALNEKEELYKKINKCTLKDFKHELTDQLFEVSKILYRKNKNCSIIMVLLFINILCLCFFIFEILIG